MRCVNSVAAALLAVAVVACPALAPSEAVAQSPSPVSRSDQLPGPDLRATLDENDEFAVLDAIHVALSQVGDGSSYVWHRHHGRLSGVMQPTASFKGQTGQVCRHLVVMLVSGRHVQKTEGVACRIDGGRWQLIG